jgi:hypothetical protein
MKINSNLETWLNKKARENFKTHRISKEFKVIILIILVLKLLSSIVSGFASNDYINSLLNNFFAEVVLNTVLSVLLLISIEFLTQYSISKFSKFILKKDVTKVVFLLVIVVTCFSVSFVLTTNGLALKYSEKADNTQQIKQAYDIEKQSIIADYDNRINEQKTNIELLKKQTWRGRLSRKYVNDIKEHSNNITQLRNEKKNTISELTKTTEIQLKNNRITTTKEAEKYYNFAVIVMIAQLFLNFILMLFWRMIYIENDTKSFIKEDIDTIKNEMFTEMFNVLKSEQKELQTIILNSYKNALAYTDIKEIQQQPQQSSAIGYKLNNNVLNNTQHTKNITPVNNARTPVTHGKTTCKNCNTEFEKKAYNQIYCSELCRLEFYEKKTGKNIQNLKNKHIKK